MPRLLFRFIVFACFIIVVIPSSAVAQDSDSSAARTDKPTCAVTADDLGTPNAEETSSLAEWQTVPLTDARTGDEFAIGDFVGCTVFVETMATWCSNCRRQLEYVASAAEELDPNQFVFIAISVETEISADDLARYADDAEFDWVFSVATPDALKMIVDEFGRESIVPSSTPHVIVNPDGTYDDLHTGYVEADDIVTQMRDASTAIQG